MRIRRKFLQLTRYTYPYGTEGFLKSYLPEGTKKDAYGNYYHLVGENPTTMFTCHLDTACSKQVKVNHVLVGNTIKTDGKSILGADDKAGMVVVLNMIENKVPGLYYFFIGEEVGCIGSGKLAENWANIKFSNTISKVVSFDRRSDCSVITHQFYGRCCSDEFAEELSFRLNSTGQRLNLEPDDTGVLTDSAQFMEIVPECTNISVGYMYEHTTNECQDIDYLQRLCKAVCLIDWESLPVERDHTEEEYDYDYYDGDDYEYEEVKFVEDFYSYFLVNGKTKKMYISSDVIAKEHDIIFNWLQAYGYSELESIDWNGNSLHVKTSNGAQEFVGNRVELMEMISELSSVPMSKIKENLNNDKSELVL